VCSGYIDGVLIFAIVCSVAAVVVMAAIVVVVMRKPRR
jgi:hypothetical protein